MKRRRTGLTEEVRRRRERHTTQRLVVETSRELERPAPDPRVVGTLPHFLERTERLGEGARALALRLYYDHALCRFVARRALGLEPELRAHEDDLPGEAERRAVLDLEPGESPGRLVVDGRGLLVTCLAPGMAVSWGERVSHEALEGHLAAHARWIERQAGARELAEAVDFNEVGRFLEGASFLAPREAFLVFEAAGPAVEPVLAAGLARAVGLVRGRFRAACSSNGPRTDAAVRGWLEADGVLAIWLTLHGDLWIKPAQELLGMPLALLDPIAAMLVGASTARSPRGDGLSAIYPDGWQEPARSATGMRETAAATFAGVSRRLLDVLPREPEDEPRIAEGKRIVDGVLHSVLEKAESAGRQGEGPPEPEALFAFVRDLALLGLGESPDWGPDLEVDPATLPLPRVEELCLPGGAFSIRPLRQLALRLLASFPRDPLALFLSAAELERAAPSSTPRARPGRFLPPFVRRTEPRRAGAGPGRNDPCPCGSGKKYKKCCLVAPGGGDEP